MMQTCVTMFPRSHVLMKTFCRSYRGRLKPSKSSAPETLMSHRDECVTEIIDVRTPAEFAEDRIPGAVNLPVLTNAERVTVGTLYSKDKFAARKLGAALISANISSHIQQHFQSKTEDYSPLVYCWRGGQRSYSLSLVLAQIGFQTFVLEGGYKEYRGRLRKGLKTVPDQFQYKVISGLTGSGKTHILHALQSHGHQILDLEGLARHKGSVLGLWHGETQPSQKYFESLILHELQSLCADRPVWLESESVRIGNLYVPDRLFQHLQHGPRYNIVLPLEERVKHILRDYPNWYDSVENRINLKDVLKRLVQVRGHAVVNKWLQMIDNEQWAEFVEDMLVNHYDPTYTNSQKKNNHSSKPVEDINIPNLNQNTLHDVVDHLTGTDTITEVEM